MLEIYKNRYNQFLCTNSLETDIDAQSGIVFQIKETLDEDAEVLVELQNTGAGGGDTEIAEVDYTIGSLRLKFSAAKVETIDEGYYWGEAVVTISSKEYILFQTKVLILPVAVA